MKQSKRKHNRPHKVRRALRKSKRQLRTEAVEEVTIINERKALETFLPACVLHDRRRT